MKAIGLPSAVSVFSPPAGHIQNSKCSLHEQWEPYPWGELPTVSHQVRCMSSARNTKNNRNTTTSLGALLEGISSDHFIGRAVYSCVSPEWLASVLSLPLSL